MRAFIAYDVKAETYNVALESGICLTYFTSPDDLVTWLEANATPITALEYVINDYLITSNTLN